MELGSPTQPGQRRAASELNVNDVQVNSAHGVLDVFVIDTGVNRSKINRLRGLGN